MNSSLKVSLFRFPVEFTSLTYSFPEHRGAFKKPLSIFMSALISTSLVRYT